MIAVFCNLFLQAPRPLLFCLNITTKDSSWNIPQEERGIFLWGEFVYVCAYKENNMLHRSCFQAIVLEQNVRVWCHHSLLEWKAVIQGFPEICPTTECQFCEWRKMVLLMMSLFMMTWVTTLNLSDLCQTSCCQSWVSPSSPECIPASCPDIDPHRNGSHGLLRFRFWEESY